MNSVKISVIIPIYNVEKYIRKAINSVLEQTYENLEIILIDDGSTDNSGIICDEYAECDKRIHVIHKENGGIASARKVGINCATGDYATNIDPDDWIERDAYESVVKIIDRYHPDIVSFGMKKEFDGLLEVQPILLENGMYSRKQFWRAFCQVHKNAPFFLQPLMMSQCDKVVRTELFKKHEFNCDEKLKKNVDDAVVFPMLLDMTSIYIDSKCWYHYCVRKNSILWQTKHNDDVRYKILAQHLIDSYEKYGLESGCSLEFLLYKLIHHMMLDIPEQLLEGKQCKIYPKITKNSRVIVYGKGVFANRFMNSIEERHYCSIIANVDSSDSEKLKEIDQDVYDYIVIAIFNAQIVSSVLKLLAEMQIDKNKILIIEKSNIMPDFLPGEIREAFFELKKKI